MRPPSVVSACAAVVQLGAFQLGPVDLEVPAGSITTVLGPNGSGKTTLIRALLGLVPLVSGEMSIDGYRPADRDPQMLREVGFAPDDDMALIDELTAQELWVLHARVHARVAGNAHDMEAQARAIALDLDFTPPRTSIAGFSHGMKKKTQLAAAIMHRPGLLVLDEPRNGLDPLGIERLEALLRAVRTQGTTCLVATHDLRWAERIADDVLILAGGVVIATGTPQEIAGGGDFVSAFFKLLGERRVEPSEGQRR